MTDATDVGDSHAAASTPSNAQSGLGEVDAQGEAMARARTHQRQQNGPLPDSMDVDQPHAGNEPSAGQADDGSASPAVQLTLIEGSTAAVGAAYMVNADADETARPADRSLSPTAGPEPAAMAVEPPAVETTWLSSVSRTADAAAALSETLKLILEPTATTRLQGDFRTGKRLNMRRVIQYIASDYTKDKIWLRRTRPSGREYDVVIALDDSQSMASSGSTQLAIDALALVTGALDRLEVGDVAVARFGATTDFVRGFDVGTLTAAAGDALVQSFQFDQRSTNLPRLLQATLAQFGKNRTSGSIRSAADLWQLAIIISDGLCQDIDETRRLLRQAAEQRVLVVFVVVDSLREQTDPQATATSIFDLQSASYQRTAAGHLELQLVRYIDSFPFELYMVIRSADALPDALAATLRQFFERCA